MVREFKSMVRPWPASQRKQIVLRSVSALSLLTVWLTGRDGSARWEDSERKKHVV